MSDAPEVSPARDGPGVPPAPGLGLRVLVVDDEPDVLAVLAEILVRLGCRVLTAATAEQALARLGQEPVDLVLSDIRMPGLSGLDLLQAASRKRADTPVVLLTGLPSVETAALSVRHHAYDYLTKPVSVEELGQLVDRVRRDRAAGPPAAILQDVARRELGLGGLFRLGELAIRGEDPRRFLTQALGETLRALEADAGLVMLRDAEGNFTEHPAGDPGRVAALPGLLRAAFGRLVSTRGGAPLPIHRPGDPVAAMAVLVGGTSRTAMVTGVARDARRGAFGAEAGRFLLAYARTTVLAVEKMLLGEDLDGSLLDTVGALLRALESLEAKEPSLRGHSVRVSLYAAEIGARLGLSPAELVVTRRAGLLHDLGKLAILDPVLAKAGPLGEAERALVRRHPLIAENILRPIRLLAQEAAIVRHHVERYDGRGYPDGRRGTEIPLGSRIIAVADAFDAMTSPRPYRGPRPLAAARAEIGRQAGTQFDPAVAAAFAAIPEARLLEVSRYYRRIANGRVA